LRRSSRSALSPAPRPRFRPGAVALRSRLVGRLCRAAVLSARARVAGVAPPSDFVGCPGRGGGVRGASLARLAPSWPHHLRSTLPPPRQWLAGPSRRLRGHDAVGGIAKRRRRGAALGSRGRASRLELAAPPGTFSHPLGRRPLAVSPSRPSPPPPHRSLARPRSTSANPREVLTRWILSWAPAMVAVVALDALVAAPLGLLWLPADRLLDGLLLALLMGASLAMSSLTARLS